MSKRQKIKVSLAVGGMTCLVFSIPPLLFTSCSIDQNDVKYKIDGTNWSGRISGSLMDFTIDQENKKVTYGGDDEIPEEQHYEAKDLIIPDKVYDDEGNDYSIEFSYYAFCNKPDNLYYDLTGKLSLPKIFWIPSDFSFYGLPIKELDASNLLEGSVIGKDTGGTDSFSDLLQLEKVIFPPKISVVFARVPECSVFWNCSNLKNIYINSDNEEDFVFDQTDPNNRWATNGTVHMMGKWKDNGDSKPNNSILNKLFGDGYNGAWIVQNG